MNKITTLNKDEQISLLILLATFKSLHEQLYSFKGLHAQRIKMRFNNLVACCRAYEKEIDSKWLKDNTDAVDELHDAITDLIYMLRDGVEKLEPKKAKKKPTKKAKK
jgi:hypothetical protein|tara:strand:- start:1199 stop:1519 length:321 start_codon:yes stop_codon:yes gene_type:complete